MRSLVWRFAPLVLGALPAFGQGSHVRWSQTVTWKLTPLVIPPAGEELKLVLPAGQPEWIVGVQPEPRQDTVATVGEARLTTSPPPLRLRVLESLADWPRNRLSVAPGEIRISESQAADVCLVVYVKAPSGTRVIVEQNGTPVFAGKPASGIMIRNDELTAQAVRGEHDLVAHLHRVEMPPETDVLARLPDGKYLRLAGGAYVVTNKGLRDHLETFQRPIWQGEAGGCCQGPPHQRFVRLRLEVDEQGSVSAVQVRAGSRELAAVCEAAVKSWKFRPFVVEGQPVRAVATVAFFFQEDGTVITPALAGN